jgi:hypothetical protein
MEGLLVLGVGGYSVFELEAVALELELVAVDPVGDVLPPADELLQLEPLAFGVVLETVELVGEVVELASEVGAAALEGFCARGGEEVGGGAVGGECELPQHYCNME